jgi:hypothetical protein
LNINRTTAVRGTAGTRHPRGAAGPGTERRLNGYIRQMRRLISALLALLVLNTALVQSVFACEALRPSAPSAPMHDASAAMHHHAASTEHHNAPKSSGRTQPCGFMLACAAVSAPSTFVIGATLPTMSADVIEAPSAQPVAPTAAPEPPPPRSL